MTARTITQAAAQTTSQSKLDTAATLSVSLMGTTSALIGSWALTCMISAMIGSGGPLQLTQSWVSAVMGI